MRMYEEIKDMLYLRVYDAETYKGFLRMVPHVVKGPYAVCCCLGPAVITNEMLKDFSVSKNQLFADALKKMKEENPPILIHIEEAIFSGGIDNAHNILEYDFFIYDKNDVALFLLTGENYVFCASYLMDDELMKKIANKLDASFFVIPSGIHDLIFVPDAGYITASELSEMLHEANQNVNLVPEGEKLSDTVAYYDRKLQKLIDPQAKIRQPSKKPDIPPRL